MRIEISTQEIDMATVGAFRSEIAAGLADREGDEPVVLDFARVEFIDSTGIATLAQFREIVGDGGLSVEHAGRAVVRVLTLTGLQELLA